MFGVESVTVNGDLATTNYRAANGNTLTQSFCATCGTPVTAQSSARPQYRAIRRGFLDAGHDLVPAVAIWAEDARGWAQIDPALDARRRRPPPLPAAVA